MRAGLCMVSARGGPGATFPPHVDEVFDATVWSKGSVGGYGFDRKHGAIGLQPGSARIDAHSEGEAARSPQEGEEEPVVTCSMVAVVVHGSPSFAAASLLSEAMGRLTVAPVGQTQWSLRWARTQTR